MKMGYTQKYLRPIPMCIADKHIGFFASVRLEWGWQVNFRYLYDLYLIRTILRQTLRLSSDSTLSATAAYQGILELPLAGS